VRQHGCNTRSLVGAVVSEDKKGTVRGTDPNKKGLAFANPLNLRWLHRDLKLGHQHYEKAPPPSVDTGRL